MLFLNNRIIGFLFYQCSAPQKFHNRTSPNHNGIHTSHLPFFLSVYAFGITILSVGLAVFWMYNDVNTPVPSPDFQATPLHAFL